MSSSMDVAAAVKARLEPSRTGASAAETAASSSSTAVGAAGAAAGAGVGAEATTVGGGGGGGSAGSSADGGADVAPRSASERITGSRGAVAADGDRRPHSGGPSGPSHAPTASVASMGHTSGNNLVVKIGMVGDPGVGKTSLMVRYVEGKFDEDYVETLGVNFLEKTINLPTAQVIMSLWDLGGAREFVPMMPMVCMEAVAMLFLFDLTNRASLDSIREWYRQVRGLNKSAMPFLVGTKYDLFYSLDAATQEAVTKQARKFAKAMKAPLIFCSSSHAINVSKMFKVVFAQVFDVKCSVSRVSRVGDPIIEY